MRPPGPSFHVCLPWKLSTAVLTCSPDVTLISTTSEPKDTSHFVIKKTRRCLGNNLSYLGGYWTYPLPTPFCWCWYINWTVEENYSCSKNPQLLHIIKSYLFFSSSTKFIGVELTVSGFCGWSPFRPIQKKNNQKTDPRITQKNCLQPHKVKQGNKQNTASPDPQPPIPPCFCFNEPTIGNHLNQPQSSRHHHPTPTARRVDDGKIQLFDGIYRGKRGDLTWLCSFTWGYVESTQIQNLEMIQDDTFLFRGKMKEGVA